VGLFEPKGDNGVDAARRAHLQDELLSGAAVADCRLKAASHTGAITFPIHIKGLRINETFFTKVVGLAGGFRLLDRLTPLPGVKSVDYVIGGFALELKILTADPLEAPERQARIREFLAREFPRGAIWVTPTKQSMTLVGALSKEYWERYLGKPTQDRLDTAATQITDTQTFLPDLRGAVLIVNLGSYSLDALSLTHLANHYQDRFEAIKAVYVLNLIPAAVGSEFQIFFSSIAKQGHRPEADALGQLLERTLTSEIERITGRPLRMAEVDAHARSGRAMFQLTQNGVIFKGSS
jgi:hypothetical protein